jgi:hypothetical protein
MPVRRKMLIRRCNRAGHKETSMTHRFAITLILFLASACAVEGEDPAGLEEIQATCNIPDRDPGGKLAVRIYQDGRVISQKTLDRTERQSLDRMVADIGSQEGSEDVECELYDDSIYCTDGFTECQCWWDGLHCECWEKPGC